MITLSRFLLANKINFKNKDVIKKVGRKVFYKSKYTFSSNFHERKVTLDTKKNKWEIIDHFISHEKQIILRWRLLPTSWNHLSKLVFESSLARISIESSNNIRSCKLIEGIESRFYSEKSIIPVVEIIVSGYEGKLKTLIDLF